jgi:hypothetical protein
MSLYPAGVQAHFGECAKKRKKKRVAEVSKRRFWHMMERLSD